MKLILSRKGFDAGYGGVPSPIFPDRSILSFPIPAKKERISFADMTFGALSVGDLVEQLSGGKILGTDTAHLDPDLNRDLIKRGPSWVPAFGQANNAQSHLANQKVGKGDLFLFYGWFREVGQKEGKWRYKRGARDLHVIFGWLRINEVVEVGSDPDSAIQNHPGLEGHPHCYGSEFSTNNTVYIGSDAGTFETVSERHILTDPNETRSIWRLPRAFYPDEKTPMTFHKDHRRWIIEDDEHVRLKTVPKGQEFVLNLDEYPEVHEWVAGVLG